MKTISRLFSLILCVLLLLITIVIWNSTLQSGGNECSVEIAYLYSIPFLIGIVLYLIGVFYLKKSR